MCSGRTRWSWEVERVLADAVLRRHRGRNEGHSEEHHRGARPGASAMIFVLTPSSRSRAVARKSWPKNPAPHVRELAEAAESGLAPFAIDDATWWRCADIGWFALGVPESLGGVGCGPTEEIMLFTELGGGGAPALRLHRHGRLDARPPARKSWPPMSSRAGRGRAPGRRVRARRRTGRARGAPDGARADIAGSSRSAGARQVDPSVRLPGRGSVRRWPRSTIRSCWRGHGCWCRPWSSASPTPC